MFSRPPHRSRKFEVITRSIAHSKNGRQRASSLNQSLSRLRHRAVVVSEIDFARVKPGRRGLKLTATVHDEFPSMRTPHVPPVPGYTPPLNVNGATGPDPETSEANQSPEFVTVMYLSSVAVRTTEPKIVNRRAREIQRSRRHASAFRREHRTVRRVQFRETEFKFYVFNFRTIRIGLERDRELTRAVVNETLRKQRTRFVRNGERVRRRRFFVAVDVKRDARRVANRNGL